MGRKIRRQRVALRFRRREVIKRQLRVGLIRGVAWVLLMGLGVGLVAGRGSFLSRFILRHTPQVDVNAPGALSGIPIAAELPARKFWLWFSPSDTWLEKRIVRKYRSVRAVHMEKHFKANRIVVRVDPRIPLVVWDESGFDRDGVSFALAPETWKTLPRMHLTSTVSPALISRWLDQLAAWPPLWTQVVAVSQDSLGNMELGLQTGARVIWGPLETQGISQKAQILVRVLDDAHRHLSGTSRADLRFFEQGRIIILPKGSERRSVWRNQTS